MVPVTDFTPGAYLLMAARQGEIKKTSLDKFAVVRSSGLIAMDVEKGDELVAVRLATDKDDIIEVTEKGQSIRFAVSSLRASLRTSGGVCGVRLASNDRVVSLDIAEPKAFLFVVTTQGFGKLTPIAEYPRQHRAGSGVRTFKLTEKTGDVAAARLVSLSQQVMMVTADGIIIYTPVKELDPKKGITIQGRSTQGVKVMRLDPGDSVVAISSFEKVEK